MVSPTSIHELLRLARELALQLDADCAADENLLEVRVLRAVERVEAELGADEAHGGAHVPHTRATEPRGGP